MWERRRADVAATFITLHDSRTLANKIEEEDGEEEEMEEEKEVEGLGASSLFHFLFLPLTDPLRAFRGKGQMNRKSYTSMGPKDATDRGREHEMNI